MRPYRYDIVGSFLRPEQLKQARKDYKEGKITKDQLTQVENTCIDDLVKKEKEAGLKAVTDGEFRRAFWHMDFLQALNGVQYVDQENWSVEFKGDKPHGATLTFTDRISFPEDHPFLNHFKYLYKVADDYPTKLTIPSPSMLHLIACVRSYETYTPIDYYKDHEDHLFDDIVQTYKDAIKAFYNLGARYIQFDDTSWGEFCDQKKRDHYASLGIDVDEVAKHYVDVINRIIEDKPHDLLITMHICRGNFRSTWFSSGGYEKVAPILFANCHVDGFFLEYDNERSGDFKPLRYIKDQYVVLGLVTSKFAPLERKDDIKARIKEATEYVPLDHLCLSTQCGFSSTEEGNKITEHDQWKKIALVKELAEEVWS